jgi:hypothetical protein
MPQEQLHTRLHVQLVAGLNHSLSIQLRQVVPVAPILVVSEQEAVRHALDSLIAIFVLTASVLSAMNTESVSTPNVGLMPTSFRELICVSASLAGIDLILTQYVHSATQTASLAQLNKQQTMPTVKLVARSMW